MRKYLHNHHEKFGIVAGLMGGLSFAFMSYYISATSDSFSTSVLLFQRGILGALVCGIIARKNLGSIFTGAAWPIWLRCILGAGSVLIYYHNVRHTTLGIATALTDLAPVFVLLIRSIWARSFPSWGTMAGVIATSFGLFILGQYGHSAISGEILSIGLLGALFAALAYLSLKRASAYYSPFTIVFLFSITLILLAVSMDHSVLKNWGGSGSFTAIMVAFLGVAGQLLMTFSYVYLDAMVATAVSLSAVIFAFSLDVIFLNHAATITEGISLLTIVFGICLVQKMPLLKK